MTTVPRVLIATMGSLGDLNPMLAICDELRTLGAFVAFAAPPPYQSACQKSASTFFPLGSAGDYVSTLGYTRGMLGEHGYDQFIERLNFENLEELFSQLLAAADGADIIVAPAHLVPAHLVAEKKGIPYVACLLALAHIRAPATPGTEEYRKLSSAIARWHTTLRKLRKDQCLENRVLPFSSLLRDAQTVLGVLPRFLLSDDDYRTPNLEVVGYAEYRQADRMVQDEELLAFCDEDTVAFSFGSFADACDPEYFFEESVAACKMLGRKCVYLSRYVPASMLSTRLEANVLVRGDVAPAAVFPLVGTVVHHGGTGTLMAACKHLKPMMVVPFFLDQPLNALRMQALIGAPTVSASRYDRYSAMSALQSAFERGDSMRQLLRTLMAEYRDGGKPGASKVLALLDSHATGARRTADA